MFLQDILQLFNHSTPLILDGGNLWGGFRELAWFLPEYLPHSDGLSLNIDMSSTTFIVPLPVIDFVTQLLKNDVTSRPLSDAGHVKGDAMNDLCELPCEGRMILSFNANSLAIQGIFSGVGNLSALPLLPILIHPLGVGAVEDHQ